MEMKARRWEDLNQDCLVSIFARVGLKSLACCVPYVCKSWYKATFNPDCWKVLNFQLLPNGPFDYQDDCRSDKEFVKFVVKRSGGAALYVWMSNDLDTLEALDCFSQGCPALKGLKVCSLVLEEHKERIPELIGKWKDLELLCLGTSYYSFKEILTQISTNCKSFSTLIICRNSDINDDVAFAICSLIPEIKRLILRGTFIQRENLMLILKGCRELVELDARGCIGFEADDKEILQLAGHVKNFDSTGAELYEDDYHPLSSKDVDFAYNSD